MLLVNFRSSVALTAKQKRKNDQSREGDILVFEGDFLHQKVPYLITGVEESYRERERVFKNL